MLAFPHLVAFALLTTPSDALELPQARQLHPTVAPALRTLALNLELLDPREVGYVLAEPDDFANDLKLLQGRYRDLRAAPPLAECKRFPDRELVGDLLAFNRLYRDGLTNRLTLDRVHADELKAALAETDQLYRIWDM